MLFRPFILLLVMVAAVPARAETSDEAVKAAFLPRFTRYVEWPRPSLPPAGQPLQLCIIGADPFGRLVDNAAAGQSTDGRPIALRRMPDAAGARGCHIAYVRGTRGQPTGQLLAALSRLPVLTVTDASSGGQRGMIHFVVAGGRVRFFIDEAQAGARGLGISSRLLALALGVRTRGS